MTTDAITLQSLNSKPTSRNQSTLFFDCKSPRYMSTSSLSDETLKPYLNKFLMKNSELYTWRQTIHLPQELETSSYIQKLSRDSSRGLSTSRKEEREDYDPYMIGNMRQKGYKNNRALSKESVQSEHSDNKSRQRKERELQTISSTFPTEQRINKLQKERKENLKLFQDKKKFSIIRLQMDLLSNNKDKTLEIQNLNHMSNHFDRKNLTINKIISQVKPNEDLMSPEEVKWLTVKKIQASIGNIKLHKTLKPSLYYFIS